MINIDIMTLIFLIINSALIGATVFLLAKLLNCLKIKIKIKNSIIVV